MKRMKRFLAILLAAVMVMSMGSMSVMADDADTGEYAITVSSVDTNTHTYVAYQIFDGQVNNKTISNVAWGAGIDTTNYAESTILSAIQTALKSASYTPSGSATATYPFASVSSAAEVATALSYFENDSDTVLTFASTISKYLTSSVTKTATVGTKETDGTYTYTFSDLASGYYLVMDASSTTTNQSSAYTNYILVTAGNAAAYGETGYTEYNHIAVKADYPSVSKEADKATASIGDTITFTLTGTVPDMTYYDTYEYVFHDTLSTGLTYTTGSLVVYGVTEDNEKTTLSSVISGDTSGYYLDVDSQTITITFADLKTVVGTNNYKTIVVEYKATLNSNAVLGTTTASNSNSVYVTYSNNPNESGTGTTATSTVYVHTFELSITKKNEDGSKALQGAKFVLYYEDGSGIAHYAIVGFDGKITGWTVDELTEIADIDQYSIETDTYGMIDVYGIAAGTYYLKELKAPDGYNVLSSAITLVISCTSTEDGLVYTLTVTDDSSMADASATVTTGVGSVTVYNTSGTILPTTGGIGTTIFYIVGTILVLGAAVILVTRRRMAR